MESLQDYIAPPLHVQMIPKKLPEDAKCNEVFSNVLMITMIVVLLMMMMMVKLTMIWMGIMLARLVLRIISA